MTAPTIAPIFISGSKISAFGTSNTNTHPVAPTGAETNSVSVPSCLQEAKVGAPLKKRFTLSAPSLCFKMLS